MANTSISSKFWNCVFTLNKVTLVVAFKLTLNPFTLVSTCNLDFSARKVKLLALSTETKILPNNATASRSSFMALIFSVLRTKFIKILFKMRLITIPISKQIIHTFLMDYLHICHFHCKDNKKTPWMVKGYIVEININISRVFCKIMYFWFLQKWINELMLE